MVLSKKITAGLLLAGLMISPVFAQRYLDDEDEVEDLLIQEDMVYVNDPGELSDNLLAASKYVMTVIEPAQPHDLNPKTATYVSDAQLLSGIYEGLFAYDPSSLDPTPAICEKYKISRDKKRWTFYLRTNARFSDGSTITAEDVRRSWIELMETPDAPYSSMLDIISGAEAFRKGQGSAEDIGITAVSPFTLSIRLTKPASYLPSLLCHSAFAVTHRNPTVFSGAYAISDMKDKQVILEKNEFYWDSQNVILKMICFFQSLGAEENVHFYNTGFAEWISSYDVDSRKVLRQEDVKINAEFGTEYMFFKDASAKPEESRTSGVWNLPEFRLALLEAMPWDKLRSKSYVPAPTFVYPLNGYPEVEGFSYTDAQEAKLLMMDARNSYGIDSEEKIPLYLDLSEGTLREEDQIAIYEALTPLGVEPIITFIPFREYLDYVKYCDADIVSYNWIGDFADPLAFLELFRGDSTLNVSGWKNCDFDRLIDEASGVSGTKRYELLAEAEKILLDNGIVIPMTHPVSMTVINTDEIGGWYPNAFNIHPLKYLYKKDVKPDLKNCF
ncbi:MAG: peptide ABC transporter substrate-binding protein [Treponema sp.]|nr:peptide ABC transporter substrate-binding protein [Treponema sp.]